MGHLGWANRLDLNLLCQPCGHADVVGIHTDAENRSDQNNYNQNSPKNSHFFSFSKYFEDRHNKFGGYLLRSTLF
jgi:hypothetical protein